MYMHVPVHVTCWCYMYMHTVINILLYAHMYMYLISSSLSGRLTSLLLFCPLPPPAFLSESPSTSLSSESNFRENIFFLRLREVVGTFGSSSSLSSETTSSPFFCVLSFFNSSSSLLVLVCCDWSVSQPEITGTPPSESELESWTTTFFFLSDVCHVFNTVTSSELSEEHSVLSVDLTLFSLSTLLPLCCLCLDGVNKWLSSIKSLSYVSNPPRSKLYELWLYIHIILYVNNYKHILIT